MYVRYTRTFHCTHLLQVWDSPLVAGVGQMTLGGLIVVDNADVGTDSHDIHIAEVLAVSDVGEEEEVWVSTLV